MTPELLEIARRLRTQDNRCTAEPMFCVQEQKRQHGLDSNYCDGDNYHWCAPDDEYIHAGEDAAKRLDALYADGEPTLEDGMKYERFYYFEYWETVMVAFTESGCQEYLRLNGHNHRGETRIYVESFRRCPEMLAIREFLLSLVDQHAIL